MCVVTKEAPGVFEIKNLAVEPAFQRQQRSAVQIAVDHVLLFVSQQQEGEKVPLARLDSANIHAYASLSLIRVEEHISSGLSSPGCRNLSKRVRMCRIYFKNLRFLICYV